MSHRGDPKIITHGTEVRAKMLDGAEKLYEAVAATYGPTSGLVALQKPYGPAVMTKDGVSVAAEVYLEDPIEDIGAGLLVNASKKSNDVSGDGTSATVLLGYHIMRLANQRVAAGYNAMGLRRGIEKAAIYIKEELDKLATPIDDKDLHKVASISATDEAIGQLVADTIIKVGGVGITVEEFPGLGIIQELVDGVYFEKGWSEPYFVTDKVSEEAVHENIAVLVLDKKVNNNGDIVPILEMIARETESKKVLIIGTVHGQALETCGLTHLSQSPLQICVVNPPVYGDQVLPFLEDMATVTGGKLVPTSLPADKVTADYLGMASKVIVSKDTTTIIEGRGVPEDIQHRVDTIKSQLKSEKYNQFQKERMEMRLAKLQGKIGIIKVGGATEDEQKEAKFRVDDAINATRAARQGGIVPGGATTLLRMSEAVYADPELTVDESQGLLVVYEALAEPFKQLMKNAGEDPGYRLKQVLKAKPGFGFNVTDMSEEPEDLMKAGVFDPLLVIKSVVENSCAAAAVAITTHATVVKDRDYALKQKVLNRGE